MSSDTNTFKATPSKLRQLSHMFITRVSKQSLPQKYRRLPSRYNNMRLGRLQSTLHIIVPRSQKFLRRSEVSAKIIFTLNIQVCIFTYCFCVALQASVLLFKTVIGTEIISYCVLCGYRCIKLNNNTKRLPNLKLKFEADFY